AGVAVMFGARPEADRQARRKGGIFALAGEVRSGGDRNADPVRRRAAEIGRATEDPAFAHDAPLALVVGVAATGGNAELVADIVGQITEYRPGLGADRAFGRPRESGSAEQRTEIVEAGVEVGQCIGVEIIDA